MTSHADAVLKGRLSKRHQESIELAQERYEAKLRTQVQEEEEGEDVGHGDGLSGGGKGSKKMRRRAAAAAAAAARKRGDSNLDLLNESKGKRSLWTTVKAM